VALFSQAAFMAPMRQHAYTFWPGAPFPSGAAQTQRFDGQENPRCCGALGVCVIDATGAVFLRKRPPFQRFSHCRLLG
jgi:hypothetical protein